MPDRRRFHRWPCSLKCGFDSTYTGQPGQISDISYGGARVRAFDILPSEGEDIGFRITTEENSESIELTAHVAYVDEDGFFGIQFYLNPIQKSEFLVPLFKSQVEPQ